MNEFWFNTGVKANNTHIESGLHTLKFNCLL